jgi:hypothetical protein
VSKYLLSVIEPTGGAVPDNIDEIVRDVTEVDNAMKEAGIWLFAGGLHGPESATTIRHGDKGELLTTDGPFAEGKEHIGGFSIIDVTDLDSALEWARKLSKATTLPIDVRPFREAPPVHP